MYYEHGCRYRANAGRTVGASWWRESSGHARQRGDGDGEDGDKDDDDAPSSW